MWNSRKVGEWIERQIGRELNNKKQRGWEYLKRMGRSPQVPRPITHPPTNASRRPLEKAPDEGDEAQGSHPTAKVELWCEDEQRLDLKPIVRKAWSPIGQRPPVKVHQRYRWTYLYAFAHPNSGKVHWLILPNVNAEVFSLALEHFAREVGAGTKRRILQDASCSW